ncbi:MAG: DEAD/DEAH box helicase [Acidimicrobiia bacterium]|nr:DEAD/DEAH box helicase [Acidimicrobiia bacterium]
METKQISFADLGVSGRIVSALSERGIDEPFPIQTATIADGLAGRDVCGKAQTGSGKTLAFGIPLVERTARAEPRYPHGLVLVPTRELCSQVAEELTTIADAHDLRLTAIYGGVSMGRQIDAVHDGVDIVVATPGRLIDLMERGHVHVDAVETVVIDEADQMADMGFLPQVHRIMRHIEGEQQTMLFSATLDGQVGSLIRRYLTDPIRHEVETPEGMGDDQEHRFIEVHYRDKAKIVEAISRSVGRTLVFVATKRNADRVAADLRDEGVNAEAIHGDLRQQQREKALAGFSSGDVPVLVATNVAARGLHIDDIDIVIHYDPPADYKSFVHRSGRTARAGEEGLVVTLVEWDQRTEVKRLQAQSGLHTEITKMLSNDPRLADLAAFQPEAVVYRKTTMADVSRRAGRRRRRR